jgi:AcrR family transcriptional regulator
MICPNSEIYMSTAARREREKEKRRNDIIDVAERLFFSRGYNNVTMEDIARETELARGTLYLYFKNKGDIYIAIAIRGLKILNDLFREGYMKGNTGIAKIKLMLLAVYDFYRKYPGYYMMIGNMQSRGFEKEDYPEMEEVESIHRDSFSMVLDAFNMGIRDGTVRGDIDPAKAAFILTASMQSVLNTSPADGLVEYAVDMMLRSIKGTK